MRHPLLFGGETIGYRRLMGELSAFGVNTAMPLYAGTDTPGYSRPDGDHRDFWVICIAPVMVMSGGGSYSGGGWLKAFCARGLVAPRAH